MHIKSVLNKDQNHYYYNISLEKCFYQLVKIYWQKFLWQYDNIKICQDKSSKRKFHGTKIPINIWDVNVDNLVISILVEIKTSFDIAKMSRSVKIKNGDKDENNKLMPLSIDNEKLLQK